MVGIQKVGEGQAETRWRATRRFEQADDEAARWARLDESVAELTAQLMACSVTCAEDLEAGYGAAIRLVATVLSANRVLLLLPDPSGKGDARPAARSHNHAGADSEAPSDAAYRTVATWRPAPPAPRLDVADSTFSADPAPELDLLLAPPLRSALEAGLACEAAGDLPLREATPLWQAGEGDSDWQAASRRLLLPCLGPPESGEDRLLGVLVIEGGLGARNWTRRLVVRASAAATSLATFLERARLSRALEEIRADRKRAAPLEGLGEIAHSVAHDFNNLLTAIQGYADLAELEMSEHAAGRDSLLEIQRAGSRAARLVDEILRSGQARGDEGVQDVSAAASSGEAKGPLDLAESLADLSGLIAQVAGPEIEIRMDVNAELPPVRADRDAFDRIILNLVANARDAIAETGRSGLVEIQANVEQRADASDLLDKSCEFVRLRVSDNGSGLPEGARAHLFERGFTTKPPGRGHGLGLSGASELMRDCGGRIRVAGGAKSDGRVGTAFHLDFPIG